MLTPAPTTTTLKHKNRGGSRWTETVTVSRERATLSRFRANVHGRAGERERPLWLVTMEPHIVECFEVTTTTVIQHEGGEPHTPRVERFFEVVTTFGRCIVLDFGSYSDVDVFIPFGNGPTLFAHFWSKRGHKVGHARQYAVGMGVNPDSKKQAMHTCPARLHGCASGDKRWAVPVG